MDFVAYFTFIFLTFVTLKGLKVMLTSINRIEGQRATPSQLTMTTCTDIYTYRQTGRLVNWKCDLEAVEAVGRPPVAFIRCLG